MGTKVGNVVCPGCSIAQDVTMEDIRYEKPHARHEPERYYIYCALCSSRPLHPEQVKITVPDTLLPDDVKQAVRDRS